MTDCFLRKIRVLGNILAISGYFVMLYINPLIGGITKATGLLCVIPFCVKLKLWDVVFVTAFFMSIDISYALKQIF